MHLLTPTAQYNDVVSIITYMYIYMCVCILCVCFLCQCNGLLAALLSCLSDIGY